MECREFFYERKYINEFINFSIKLYNDSIFNKNDLKKLLLDKHVLSKYFRLNKFLIYDNKKVVGRFILTNYENDDNLYIGFFECVDDIKVAKKIFDYAKLYAKNNGYKKIIGPVDASFWIRYRLKINKFDSIPYTCSPYNKEYYLNLFMNNGFRVIEHYTSNVFDIVNKNYKNILFETKYRNFIEDGYNIISPDIKDYNKVIDELYELLTNLYKDFPIYKNILKEDFIKIFSNYRFILNMDMVKLAYYNDELVGFFISVPNYHNIVNNLNLKNMFKIINIKNNPREYVLLYMGASKKGIGSALAQSIINRLKELQVPSIGALARDGKVTQKYAEDLIKDKYEYVLLEYDLND